MGCPIPQSSCINSFVYSSFSSVLVKDNPKEDDEFESEEDESESVCRRVAFGWPKMALGKWSHGPYATDNLHIQKLFDVHNSTHHPMQILDPVRKGMSIFPVRVTGHAPCMQLRQDMPRTCTQETMLIVCL